MTARVPMRIRGRRRGVVALGFAVAMLLLIFITVAAFLLAILAGGARAENAARETQALYAAEAGIDLALQAGAREGFTGRCGRARFAVKQGGNEIAALGQVERASGAPIRCAVVVRVMSGGGMVAGTWRQVAPATRPELAALLAEQGD